MFILKNLVLYCLLKQTKIIMCCIIPVMYVCVYRMSLHIGACIFYIYLHK